MNSSSGSTPKIETESGGKLDGLFIIGEVEVELMVGGIESCLTFVEVILGDLVWRTRLSGGGVGSLSLSESVPGEDIVDG